MAEALGAAAELFLVPARLGMMLLGVLAGLVVGILPGMGGIVAVAVLLPFVVRLDAIAALAMLTGALAVGSPELFMLTALGVSFAGSLLGKEPRRGIIAGLLGLLLGAVGPSPAAAQVRFSFGQIYLMDGLDLAIVALGVF